ncbi:hypothetical protein PQC07_gp033 [Aeromonas phage D3]|uniref:Uncharacterized protein n=1 Tax=Aeromonas phage D3 TaxID=2593327 RepID=A0A514TVD1_9CAUD|nr:hypothetical protein PQC07_gp033 [Aeromonas phage D3]QDJ96972.1 hypothetical protein D3_0242 [Aeromonas phage D3]
MFNDYYGFRTSINGGVTFTITPLGDRQYLEFHLRDLDTGEMKVSRMNLTAESGGTLCSLLLRMMTHMESGGGKKTFKWDGSIPLVFVYEIGIGIRICADGKHYVFLSGNKNLLLRGLESIGEMTEACVKKDYDYAQHIAYCYRLLPNYVDQVFEQQESRVRMVHNTRFGFDICHEDKQGSFRLSFGGKRLDVIEIHEMIVAIIKLTCSVNDGKTINIGKYIFTNLDTESGDRYIGIFRNAIHVSCRAKMLLVGTGELEAIVQSLGNIIFMETTRRGSDSKELARFTRAESENLKKNVQRLCELYSDRHKWTDQVYTWLRECTTMSLQELSVEYGGVQINRNRLLRNKPLLNK